MRQRQHQHSVPPIECHCRERERERVATGQSGQVRGLELVAVCACGADRCGNQTCTNYSRCTFERQSSGRQVPVCGCEQCGAARKRAGDSGPVCGSDGVTYANRCELRRESCRARKYIVERHEGHCSAPPVPLLEVADCRRILCPRSLCLDGQCICAASSRCSATSERICGSDGHWYASECALFNASCARHELIERRPPQLCAPDPLATPAADPNDLLDPYDEDVPIDYVVSGDGTVADGGAAATAACAACVAAGGTCREEAAGAAPRCDCSRVICTPQENVAYAYEYCECVPELPIAQEAACAPTCRSPTCGSDGVLYRSRCELRAAMCAQQTRLEVRAASACKGVLLPFTLSAITQETTRVRFCHSRQRVQVIVMCEYIVNLHLVYVHCVDAPVEPASVCDGRRPVLNAATGRDYDCPAEACPSGSICQRSARSATCCPLHSVSTTATTTPTRGSL